MTEPGSTSRLGESAIAMCKRFAWLHISHWREAKMKGLPRSAADARATALWWLAKAKGRA